MRLNFLLCQLALATIWMEPILFMEIHGLFTAIYVLFSTRIAMNGPVNYREYFSLMSATANQFMNFSHLEITMFAQIGYAISRNRTCDYLNLFGLFSTIPYSQRENSLYRIKMLDKENFRILYMQFFFSIYPFQKCPFSTLQNLTLCC